MKPLASLSLDLDNKWSYMKTHGDAGWDAYPSYFPILIPRVLDLLKKQNLTITFFVVGQDAALEKNTEFLKTLSAAGHEIGNHSFRHEPWLHLYSDAEIETELRTAQETIEKVTNYRPIGFRGPGFSCSEATLTTLKKLGYTYDASTFPTFLGPLARLYYFMRSNLSKAELKTRKALFGKFSEGFRPLHPYRWRTDAGEIIEIPVTTMPLLKIPIHASYILYLSCYSTALAMAYFRTALTLCRLTNTPPSILLHPLDFLGGDDEKDLSFFPAMNLPGAKKMELMSRILNLLSQQFEVVPMREHAARIAASSTVTTLQPRFAHAPSPG
jgi:peptidoglycan-N-acetylglucosamine deacetylase